MAQLAQSEPRMNEMSFKVIFEPRIKVETKVKVLVKGMGSVLAKIRKMGLKTNWEMKAEVESIVTEG